MITYEYRMTSYLWRRANREHPATGKAPISLRIEIDGYPRAEFSTGVLATAAEWNQSAQTLQPVRGMSKEEQAQLKADKAKLAERLLTIDRAYNNYKSQGGDPSPATLRELLRGGKRRETVELGVLALMERCYAFLQTKKLQATTLRNYRKTITALTRYLQHQQQTKLQARELDRAWLRRLERWYMAQGLGGGTIHLYLAGILRALDTAVDEGLLKENPLRGYTYLSQAKEPEKRHLSAEEVERLRTCALGHLTLQRVRDLFIFCCFTGLPYTDYTRFASSPAEFYVVVEGVKGISMVRQKMQYKGTSFWVPLFPEPAALLAAYQEQLPIYERSYIDKKLKVIAQAAALSLLDLKHKDARSTFAQMMRDKFDLDTAAQMAGHSKQMAEKHYSQDTPEKLVRQLRVLGAQLSSN